MRAADAVTRRTHRGLATQNLTVSQFGVLEALYHLGPLKQAELGSKILKTSGNMTMVVDNLEARGLVKRKRDAADRRAQRVSLTDAGRELIARIFPPHARKVVKEMSRLSPEEQTELARLCRKLGRDEGDAAHARGQKR